MVIKADCYLLPTFQEEKKIFIGAKAVSHNITLWSSRTVIRFTDTNSRSGRFPVSKGTGRELLGFDVTQRSSLGKVEGEDVKFGILSTASFLQKRKQNSIGFETTVCGMESSLGRTLFLKEETSLPFSPVLWPQLGVTVLSHTSLVWPALTHARVEPSRSA